MKIWKIVSGILSIVLSFLVVFQSCAAGFVNAITSSGEMSGSVGLLVALLMLAGGIVAIASRDALSNAWNVALIIIYGIATFSGYFGAGIFGNLVIFSTWCLLCAVMAAIAIAADNICGPLVYIIIVIAGVIIAAVGFSMNFHGTESGGNRSSGSNGFTQKSEDEPSLGDTEDDGSDADDQSPDSATMTGSGDLGDYHVEIKGASIMEDYEGNPAIVITYSWTNNSDKTTSAMVAVYGKAFQDGVQLDNAIIMGADGYESGTSMKDVRPGTTIDVQTAFTLTSETSVVEFELSELISFSNELVSMNFEPSNLS